MYGTLNAIVRTTLRNIQVTDARTPPPTVPIRDNLFVQSDSSGPLLFARKCEDTGQVFYPRDSIEPGVSSRRNLCDIELEGRGRIVAFTIVRRALPGFESPYALAVVELKEGVSLFAQIEGWTEDTLQVGVPVKMLIGTIRKRTDGTELVGPKFQIVTAS